MEINTNFNTIFINWYFIFNCGIVLIKLLYNQVGKEDKAINLWSIDNKYNSPNKISFCLCNFTRNNVKCINIVFYLNNFFRISNTILISNVSLSNPTIRWLEVFYKYTYIYIDYNYTHVWPFNRPYTPIGHKFIVPEWIPRYLCVCMTKIKSKSSMAI